MIGNGVPQYRWREINQSRRRQVTSRLPRPSLSSQAMTSVNDFWSLPTGELTGIQHRAFAVIGVGSSRRD